MNVVAPKFVTIVIATSLCGLSSAGASLTLGMTDDIWKANNHVLLSACGFSIAPAFRSLMQDYLSGTWNFRNNLIFGGVMQLVHFFFISKTKATILVDRDAKRRGTSGDDIIIYGHNEFLP